MNTEYKTVCNKCRKKTWYETEQPCKMTIFKGCGTCGSHEYIDEPVKCAGTLKLIDNSSLDSRLDSFYKSKERIEVIYKDGTKARFYVGKSTGWKPVYLEIAKSNSTGGGAVYLPKDCEIRGTGKHLQPLTVGFSNMKPSDEKLINLKKG